MVNLKMGGKLEEIDDSLPGGIELADRNESVSIDILGQIF